jgi:hypothetical protein
LSHRTTAISKDDFIALLGGERAADVTGQEETLYPNGVIDIWYYVNSVPRPELNGYSIADGDMVEYVYRTAKGPFDLVHVMTNRKNVYLVVVIDVTNDRIHGHHFLDLNEEFGLGPANDA